MAFIVVFALIAAVFLLPDFAVWSIVGVVLVIAFVVATSQGKKDAQKAEAAKQSAGSKYDQIRPEILSEKALVMNDTHSDKQQHQASKARSSYVDDFFSSGDYLHAPSDPPIANYYDEDLRFRVHFEWKMNNSYSDHRANIERYQHFVANWAPFINEHNQLVSDIGVAYAVANHIGTPNSPEVQRAIDLCVRDISLAETYKTYVEEKAKLFISIGWARADDISATLPLYSSFKKLALLYERQHDYDNAIAVCRRAIELGYNYDGTEGQMPGRLARLIRKKNSRSSVSQSTTRIDTSFCDPDQSSAINSISSESATRIINDSFVLVTTTINPETFFTRLNLLVEKQNELLESGTPLNDSIPNYTSESLYQSEIASFIKRSFVDVTHKAQKLKTEKGKTGRFQKHHFSLMKYRDFMNQENVLLLDTIYKECLCKNTISTAE